MNTLSPALGVAMQVARDLGTLWATLQPPSDCSPQQREALLLDVVTASAAAHATWQSEQDSVTQVVLQSEAVRHGISDWLS